MALFGKGTVIGLDIGSSQVKAVELEPHGGSYRLRAFGFAAASDDGVFVDAGSPLPEEACVLAQFERMTDEHGEVVYRDANGEQYRPADLGEDFVFEVIAGLTGQKGNEQLIM